MPQAEFFARSPAPPSEPPAWLGMDANAFKAAVAAAPDRNPVAGSPPIRATRRAADWTAAIYRAYTYVAGRIGDPFERAKLDELREETLAAGPDFARVRRSAIFGPVQVVAYDKDVAREIMRQAREIERESYATRAKGKHGGALGKPAIRVLEWFCYSLWPRAKYGMVPSLAAIASGVQMSKPTVVEAIKQVQLFGFLTVQPRRKLIAAWYGGKVVQDTNSYVLGLARGLGALALAAFDKKRPKPPEPPPADPWACGTHPPLAEAPGRPGKLSESTKLPAIRIDLQSLRAERENRLPEQGFCPRLE